MNRMAVALAGIALVSGTAMAQESDENRAVTIGPWQVEASYRAEGKFDRCVMSRTTEDGVETRITRDESGLSLTMMSPRWKLDKGKTYPVEFVTGSKGWKTDVTATRSTVRVDLSDADFNDRLRKAETLEVRAEGSTITVPLDKSAAAMSRLESCYETNSKAVETNPFVKPKATP
jgi:hypothetical protein